MPSINCLKIRDNIFDRLLLLRSKVSFRDFYFVIILVGKSKPSIAYVNKKIEMANKIGLKLELKKFDNISQDDLIFEIERNNNNNNVIGIIVQLPLPHSFDRYKILNSIDPKKDIDGLHFVNAGILNTCNVDHIYSINDILDLKIQEKIMNLNISMPIIPCTALGTMHILFNLLKSLRGISILIFGDSNLVTKPIARLCLIHDATVTILNTYSINRENFISQADLIILATGKKKVLDVENCKKNAIIIDIGISFDENNKIHGDLDISNILAREDILYTPVPGGIGPITVISIMCNMLLLSMYKNATL